MILKKVIGTGMRWKRYRNNIEGGLYGIFYRGDSIEYRLNNSYHGEIHYKNDNVIANYYIVKDLANGCLIENGVMRYQLNNNDI